MNPLTISMPVTLAQTLALQAPGDLAHDVALPVLKAGGMDLLDQMKEGLIAPDRMTNFRHVKDPSLRRISGGTIGPLVTLADIASSETLRRIAPAIAQAAGAAATPQVRNVATAAGNLLQRPRCWYFRNEQFSCLKKGGHTCYAVEGENRYHAIFGDGPCHIVHPSNLANALAVCAATIITRKVDIQADAARREIPIDQLYTMPDRNILTESTIEPGEIVVEINYQPAPHSAHYEIREKQSFDWPLVMVSAAVELDGDDSTITAARICAGAVAPIPWRLPAVERALVGVSVDDEAALRRACQLAAQRAKPMTDNAYKTRLLNVAVFRAVRLAAGRHVDDMFRS